MTLPTSGPLGAVEINVELGRFPNEPFSLGGEQERALAAKWQGPISFGDFHGKSNINREPPYGELYDDMNYWGLRFPLDGSNAPWNHRTFIRMFGNPITPLIPGELSVLEHNGWRYHRGTERDALEDWQTGGLVQTYAFWREML